MTFNGRHGFIFLKIELFIVAAVRISNPANPNTLYRTTAMIWEQTAVL
jgi:hypothetical protein